MNRSRAILIAVVVLALLSAGLGYVAGRRASESAHVPDETYLAHLSHDLDLRPDQVAAIDRLLAAEHAELTALAREYQDSMRAPVADRRQRTEDAMLALLDDTQRSRYDQLTSR